MPLRSRLLINIHQFITIFKISPKRSDKKVSKSKEECRGGLRSLKKAKEWKEELKSKEWIGVLRSVKVKRGV